MDLNHYQQLAMRTSPDDHDRVKNGCLGLIGESGEIVDVIKKWMFQSVEGTPLPVDKLVDEMGDVLWYCAEVATGLDMSLQDALVTPIPGFQHTPVDNAVDDLAVSMAHNAASIYNFLVQCDDGAGRMYGVWYLHYMYDDFMRLCDMVGETIQRVAEGNIEKLKKRYPDGFDPVRSMNRPEYTTLPHKEQAESESSFLFTSRNKPI